MGYEERMAERLSGGPDYQADLDRVFGPGADVIVRRITHDDPSLSPDDVLKYAWQLISEATAFMMPANPEDLTANALSVYEAYRGASS